MSGPVSGAEREHFRSRGYFVRSAVLSPGELEPLCRAVEGVHDAVVAEAVGPRAAAVERIDERRYQQVLGSTVKWEWREDAPEIRSMEPFAHLDARLDALIDDPRLWRPAAELLGVSAVSLFTDKLNFKRPRGAPFPWHQDAPYWAFGCDHVDRLASLQVYLDDATVENGCLWVVPGTHARGLLPTVEDRGVLDRLYTDPAALGEAERVPLEAPAGSVIWFDGYLVHGSRGNRSAGSRRAVVLTYQPTGLPRWRTPVVRSVGEGLPA